jgi:hypothetical protein
MQEVPEELRFQQSQFDPRVGRPQFLAFLTPNADFWNSRRDTSLRSYVAHLVEPLVAKVRSDG